MDKDQLEYLDQVSHWVKAGRLQAYRPLSSGERVYVALAASRADLLESDGYTLVQGWNRLERHERDWLRVHWAHA